MTVVAAVGVRPQCLKTQKHPSAAHPRAMQVLLTLGQYERWYSRVGSRTEGHRKSAMVKARMVTWCMCHVLILLLPEKARMPFDEHLTMCALNAFCNRLHITTQSAITLRNAYAVDHSPHPGGTMQEAHNM